MVHRGGAPDEYRRAMADEPSLGERAQTSVTESRSGQPGDSITWPIGCFLVGLVACVLAVWLGFRAGEASYYGSPAEFRGSSVLGGFVRWDGGWYRQIAQEGYFYAGTDRQSSIAFFPVYPLVVRAVSALGRLPVELTGILVTMASGLAATALFWRWCRATCGVSAARLSVLLLVAYPYAVYLYGAMYADALFLAAALAAFALVELDHPVWAGVAGAVASATRPVGIAVIIGLVAVVAMRRKVLARREGTVLPRIDLQSFRAGDSGVLLSVTGLVAWMLYLGVRFRDPIAFQTVQEAPGWDQPSGPHTWLKVPFWERLHRMPQAVESWWSTGATGGWEQVVFSLGLLLQAVIVVVAGALVVVVWRRIGWAYAVYAVVVIAIPLLGSKDFQGVGRYMLAAFPCLAALALVLLPKRVVTVAVVVGSATLMVTWAFAFGRGYYIA
jgi:hypothetical protein